MAHGKHRKPTDTLSLKKIALGVSVGLGAAVVPATTASAATVGDWDRLAFCESTGNWSYEGAYSGGLQFSAETWAEFGGLQYAPTAGQATKEQQILVAEKLLAARGGEPWHVITHDTGNTSQGSCQGLLDASDAYANGGPNPFPATSAPTPADPAPSTGTTSSAQKAIDWALDKVEAGNLRYVWGGTGPTGYDCSGFVQAAWKAAGVNIPRDTYGMNSGLPKVSQSDMRPGDLVLLYFPSATGPAPNHVGMYIGDGKMVEMSGSRGNVVSSLSNRGGSITGIVRPAASEAPAPSTPSPKPTPTPEAGNDYTVKAGDTLSGIARALNVEGGWSDLYAANKDVIGDDPNVIHPGLVLKVPNADAYEFSGLPQVDQESPSAEYLQKQLKRVGYMATSVESHPNYGPNTQSAVAAFHEDNRQFKSVAGADVQIGPKGWAHLRQMKSGSAEIDASAPATPKPSTPAPASGDAVAPVDASPGYAFGTVNSDYSAGYHTGVDFAVPSGTTVRSVAAGTVHSVINSGNAGYGLHVIIKHADGKYTLYAHLSWTAVVGGQSVAAGQTIGSSGNSGNTTGPHLHFEVRNSPNYGDVAKPVEYLRSLGVSI